MAEIHYGVSLLGHHSKNLTSNETLQLSRLLEAGASLPVLLLSALSIPLNCMIIFVIKGGKQKPEGAVHMLLLAVADILFVTTPWLMFALHSFGEGWGSICDVKCLWGIYEYASTITITQNRWMTFFMASSGFSASSSSSILSI